MNEFLEKWANKQFERVNFGDKRLNKRAQIIAGNMITKPKASINMQGEGWGGSKGAYPFFDFGWLKVLKQYWEFDTYG